MNQRTFKPEFDLASGLRQFRHIASSYGLLDDERWADRELNGHGDDPPDWRFVSATHQWRGVTPFDNASLGSIAIWGMRVPDPTPTVVPVKVGANALTRAVESGFAEATGKQDELSVMLNTARIAEFVVVGPEIVRRLVDHIGNELARRASAMLALIDAGETVTEVFDEYRSFAEPAIRELGLESDLNEMTRSLASNSVAGRRRALYAARTCLQQVAEQLWHAPTDIYRYLPNSRDGSGMNVSSGSFVNQLIAYVHQKADGETGLLRAQLDGLGGLLGHVRQGGVLTIASSGLISPLPT
ncbi:MAG: hypothetical protein O3C10_12730, partial [Chloroflexi bacterium]|nr:hypothetical protein [Chloroflexota bacterium]